jgi:hypothetical protein
MASRKADKRKERNIKTRKRLWNDVDDTMVWDSKPGGFSMMPRTMPYFARIMDKLSQGKPVFSTYFALWCRMWDESGLVTVSNSLALAKESGFSGHRALSTWRSRMKLLEKQGWIMAKKLGDEPFGYVLMLNPYFVVKKMHDEREYQVDEGWYNALLERQYAIGVSDIDDLENEAEEED